MSTDATSSHVTDRPTKRGRQMKSSRALTSTAPVPARQRPAALVASRTTVLTDSRGARTTAAPLAAAGGQPTKWSNKALVWDEESTHRMNCTAAEAYEQDCVNGGKCFVAMLDLRRTPGCKCPYQWRGSRCESRNYETSVGMTETQTAGLATGVVFAFFLIVAAVFGGFAYCWFRKKRQNSLKRPLRSNSSGASGHVSLSIAPTSDVTDTHEHNTELDATYDRNKLACPQISATLTPVGRGGSSAGAFQTHNRHFSFNDVPVNGQLHIPLSNSSGLNRQRARSCQSPSAAYGNGNGSRCSSAVIGSTQPHRQVSSSASTPTPSLRSVNVGNQHSRPPSVHHCATCTAVTQGMSSVNPVPVPQVVLDVPDSVASSPTPFGDNGQTQAVDNSSVDMH